MDTARQPMVHETVASSPLGSPDLWDLEFLPCRRLCFLYVAQTKDEDDG